MKRIIICLFLMNIISCEMNNHVENKLETYTHKNDLTISVDQSISDISHTESGFKLNISGQDARSINEVKVIKSSSSPENLDQYKTKDISNKKYYYSLESFNEGSGGEEYTLTIWKPVPEGGIIIEHFIQQETKPDFEISWAIAKHAN